MKRRLNIFIVVVLTLTSILNACSNGSKTNSKARTTINFNDTTFIKSIKWDSLNTFVDFHILQKGSKTTDTNFHFTAKTIAVFHYFNNQFEAISDSRKLNFKSSELKKFLLSDSFSNRKNFACLLRINTKIGLQCRPDLLRTVIVRPKDMSEKNIKLLVNNLKKELFSESVNSKIQRDTLLNKATETVFINIKLKSNFWSLKKIEEVCSQLNNRSNIDQAFFPDFFTGQNEGETFYHLTTDQKSSR